MNKDNVKIKIFEDALIRTRRPGIDRLLDYIRKTDFYTAPASTRFHSCHEGGLLEHSLNVFNCLIAKQRDTVWKDSLKDISEDSLAICSLLHDLCKTNFYIIEYRNKKVYSESGKKIDSKGRYDWQAVPCYSVEDKFPYGHGEKSVMMIEQFVRLKPVEKYAIRWHMGFTEPKENWNYLTCSIQKYPLVLALFESDLEATYLLEKEE